MKQIYFGPTTAKSLALNVTTSIWDNIPPFPILLFTTQPTTRSLVNPYVPIPTTTTFAELTANSTRDDTTLWHNPKDPCPPIHLTTPAPSLRAKMWLLLSTADTVDGREEALEIIMLSIPGLPTLDIWVKQPPPMELLSPYTAALWSATRHLLLLLSI